MFQVRDSRQETGSLPLQVALPVGVLQCGGPVSGHDQEKGTKFGASAISNRMGRSLVQRETNLPNSSHELQQNSRRIRRFS
jgi:hypothetical protein